MLEVFIPGTPKAKARARVTKSGHAFTPKDTVNYENWVKEKFLEQHPEHIPLKGPIRMTAKFYFPRPKKHYRTGKFSEDLRADAPKYHSNTPDLDNLIKSITDGLNGIAFKDDSQIFCLTDCIKGYTDHLPGAVIEIEEM